LFIVVTYLYAYHSEIYTALFHYEDFRGTLTNFCANREEFLGIKDKDEVLEPDLIKENEINLTEELPNCLTSLILPLIGESRLIPIFKNDVQGEKFPIDNLRQVFWIRKLISENELPLKSIKKFKFD